MPFEKIKTDACLEAIDRYQGCLLGLATGDAVGTTVEFMPPGTFAPITGMTGGGPFGLQAGQWTDDTSLALCLAESLIAKEGFDPEDQMIRYLQWFHEGHLSSTGVCFDIGNTTHTALQSFERSGNPYSGPEDRWQAGNGSIMRLGAIPLFFASTPEMGLARAKDSSRTTHGAITAIDACRYLAALIIGAVNGASKEDLLSPYFCPVENYWASNPLSKEIDEIAAGSFKLKTPPQIRGSGYVVESLEAALWAFYHSTNFEDGCLLAVNLGDDADTTAAVYGQIAGAHYGKQNIPKDWLQQLSMRPMIESFATELHRLAQLKH